MLMACEQFTSPHYFVTFNSHAAFFSARPRLSPEPSQPEGQNSESREVIHCRCR